MNATGEAAVRDKDDELKAMREAFAEFAAAAVHDLKGPANHIRAFLGILLEDIGASADPEIVKHLNNATDRMHAVLEALAAYAEVVTQEYIFEEVDTGGLVSTAASRFGPAIDAGQLVVEAAGLPVVRADPKQLLKVFVQLIDNAAKFRSEAVPHIEFSAVRAGAEWVFSACDNGIGINPASRELIFKPLRRLWGDKYPGAGIGLAIASRILRIHGGRIWMADPPPVRGACLHFTLPAE